jgi:hypothetical protein
MKYYLSNNNEKCYNTILTKFLQLNRPEIPPCVRSGDSSGTCQCQQQVARRRRPQAAGHRWPSQSPSPPGPRPGALPDCQAATQTTAGRSTRSKHTASLLLTASCSAPAEYPAFPYPASCSWSRLAPRTRTLVHADESWRIQQASVCDSELVGRGYKERLRLVSNFYLQIPL